LGGRGGGGGGGGLGCAFLLLVTVTGIASGPFSTVGLVDTFFLSCDLANMPIQNRQSNINDNLSFI
jgi:hypothetical protein